MTLVLLLKKEINRAKDKKDHSKNIFKARQLATDMTNIE